MNDGAQILSEEVTFVAGGRTIPGTLVHPESGSGAGLLLLAGSGLTDRDWNSPLLPGKNGSARLLAEPMATRGVTVLRFDTQSRRLLSESDGRSRSQGGPAAARRDPSEPQLLQTLYNAPDRTLAEDLVEVLAQWIRDR